MTFTPDQAFALTVQYVLADEGVMTDNAKTDPEGGLTKFGFSQKQNPDLDVANLTTESATALYRQRYWDELGCDSLPWPASFLVFDCAVNQGVGAAHMLMERTVKVCPIGDPWEFTARFCAMRLQSYVGYKEYPANGQGWFFRVTKNLMAAGRASITS